MPVCYIRTATIFNSNRLTMNEPINFVIVFFSEFICHEWKFFKR